MLEEAKLENGDRNQNACCLGQLRNRGQVQSSLSRNCAVDRCRGGKVKEEVLGVGVLPGDGSDST